MSDPLEPTRRAEPDQHLVALAAGTMLGKYRLEAVLGQGGFGITYRAIDTELDRAVAIKEYLPADVAVRVDGTTVKAKSRGDEDSFAWGLSRFLDEAKALARFEDAPGIVRVHDYLQANGTAYMVMALVEGVPLNEIYRRQGSLPEQRLKPIALALLDGLEKVHHAGFLHRDIKPANILLRANDQPVLVDFGAARQALGERSRSITGIYTPGYAPFEQYMSEGKQGPWTDIYALAATLYQGVSGRVPPQATDRMREDAMVPAARVGAGRYSDAFLDAIDHGLAVHERDRPQSVDQWRAMLLGTTKAPGRKRAGGLRLALAGGALVVVALGGAGWALLGGGGQAPRDLQTELAAAEQRLRQLTEDARRAADEARKRGEEAQAALDAEIKRRAEQEARLKAEEEQRRQDELARRAADEETRRQAAEAQRKAEEARKAQEAAELEAKRRAEEEARQAAAEEARRRAEAEEVRQAEERRRLAEQARQVSDLEAKRRAEEEARRQAEAEAARRAAAEKAEEQRRTAEAARQKAEAELAAARRAAEEEARRLAAIEAQRRAEEEARQKADAEARQKAEEARQKADAELAESRRQAEAAQKEAELRQRQAEQARLAAEAEAKRLADAEAKRKEEEAKKKAEADAKAKVEAEAKKKAEEEAKKKAEADAKAKAEAEAKKKAEEEAKKKAEQQAAATGKPGDTPADVARYLDTNAAAIRQALEQDGRAKLNLPDADKRQFRIARTTARNVVSAREGRVVIDLAFDGATAAKPLGAMRARVTINGYPVLAEIATIEWLATGDPVAQQATAPSREPSNAETNAYMLKYGDAIRAAIVRAVNDRPGDFSNDGRGLNNVNVNELAVFYYVAHKKEYLIGARVSGVGNAGVTVSIYIKAEVAGYPNAPQVANVALTRNRGGMVVGATPAPAPAPVAAIAPPPLGFAYAGYWTPQINCTGGVVMNPIYSNDTPITGPSFNVLRSGTTMQGSIDGERMELRIKWFSTAAKADYDGKFSLRAESALRFTGSGVVSGFLSGPNSLSCSILLLGRR